MATPRPYLEAVNEHRRKLDRIITRRGLQPLKKLYHDAHAALATRLSAIGPSSTRFTAQQHRIMLMQIRQGEMLIARRMAGELGDISQHAQTEALRDLIEQVTKLEHAFTGAEIILPIEEAGRFRGIINMKRESLLRSHQASLASYTTQVVTAMEDELSTSLMTGESLSQAIDRIQGVTGNEWWQAERIARTEIAGAYNASHAEGMRETAADLPDMMMQWREQVDDVTGEPLDSRVSMDSVLMHGQLAAPGEMFILPKVDRHNSPLDADDMKRFRHLYSPGAWAFPPNRPNDRATITSWRPHWGVPGYRLVGGRRVEIKGGEMSEMVRRSLDQAAAM